MRHRRIRLAAVCCFFAASSPSEAAPPVINVELAVDSWSASEQRVALEVPESGQGARPQRRRRRRRRRSTRLRRRERRDHEPGRRRSRSDPPLLRRLGRRVRPPNRWPLLALGKRGPVGPRLRFEHHDLLRRGGAVVDGDLRPVAGSSASRSPKQSLGSRRVASLGSRLGRNLGPWALGAHLLQGGGRPRSPVEGDPTALVPGCRFRSARTATATATRSAFCTCMTSPPPRRRVSGSLRRTTGVARIRPGSHCG